MTLMQELGFFAFAFFWFVKYTGDQDGGPQALKTHYSGCIAAYHSVSHRILNYRGRHPTQTRLSALEPWLTFVYSEAYYTMYSVLPVTLYVGTSNAIAGSENIDRYFPRNIHEIRIDRVGLRGVSDAFFFSFSFSFF